MSQPGGALWPADVIHVNEDGWVLINRGSQHGVSVGLRLVVVGTGLRDLYDLFGPDAAAEGQVPVLRIRRTYELLEVIYAEDTCAIAIATRTPASRRPTVYRGPEGELLVWVPLPEGYSWPPRSDSPAVQQQPGTPTPPWVSSSEANAEASDEDADPSEEPDMPPEQGPQDDELWEEALPLNSVGVGDIVLPALPAVPETAPAPPIAAAPPVPPGSTSDTAADGHESSSPFGHDLTYDWMKKPGG